MILSWGSIPLSVSDPHHSNTAQGMKGTLEQSSADCGTIMIWKSQVRSHYTLVKAGQWCQLILEENQVFNEMQLLMFLWLVWCRV